MLPCFRCGASREALIVKRQQSVKGSFVVSQERKELVGELVIARSFTLFESAKRMAREPASEINQVEPEDEVVPEEENLVEAEDIENDTEEDTEQDNSSNNDNSI